MIASFQDKETERLYQAGTSKRFAAIVKAALRKLDMLDAAVELQDLSSPPGNRLEALEGDRKGLAQHPYQ